LKMRFLNIWCALRMMVERLKRVLFVVRVMALYTYCCLFVLQR
jgi:hypothetical protein